MSMGLKLYADGQTFDPEDLTYEEMRGARRMIRLEIWDPVKDGAFAWAEVSEFEMYPAMLCVFKRRDDPDYTLEQALKLKIGELTDEAPPTQPAAKRSSSSSRRKVSATAGSPSSP